MRLRGCRLPEEFASAAIVAGRHSFILLWRSFSTEEVSGRSLQDSIRRVMTEQSGHGAALLGRDALERTTALPSFGLADRTNSAAGHSPFNGPFGPTRNVTKS